MAAGYVFRVVGHAFTPARILHQTRPVPMVMALPALALAMLAILLGFFAPALLAFMAIGLPFGEGGGG